MAILVCWVPCSSQVVCKNNFYDYVTDLLQTRILEVSSCSSPFSGVIGGATIIQRNIAKQPMNREFSPSEAESINSFHLT